MMLTLLSLALPTAALANGVSFTTGTFKANIHSSIPSRTSSGGFGTAGSNFRVGVDGSMNFIFIGGTSLGMGRNVAGDGMCSFTGGTVTVRSAPGAPILFENALENGMITKTATTAIITAELVPSADAPTGGFVRFVVSFGSTHPISDRLTGGSAIVLTPEPSALEGLLLGTGLLGLVELARRKLTLGAARLGLAP